MFKSVTETRNCIDIGCSMESTKFSLSYGVSKLIGGVLSDVVSPKFLYVVGLVLGSLVRVI